MTDKQAYVESLQTKANNYIALIKEFQANRRIDKSKDLIDLMKTFQANRRIKFIFCLELRK